MSVTVEIRRDGDEWIIDDGSARIRMTKPDPGIFERFVDQWERENCLRPDSAQTVLPDRPRRPEGVS